MKISVLIPYRADSEIRERLHAYTSKLWEQTGVEVIYSSDGLDGLFSYSRAINAARKKATGQCFLSYSVDALPPSNAALNRLVMLIQSGTSWVAGWRGQRRFTHTQTAMLLAGFTHADVGEPAGGISLGREALVAVRADVWDTMRGYDERFIGWGPEDKAWHFALKNIFPNGRDQPTEDLFHTLNHPTTPRSALEENIAIYREYRRNEANFRQWYFSR